MFWNDAPWSADAEERGVDGKKKREKCQTEIGQTDS